jgi:hypothetical protein
MTTAGSGPQSVRALPQVGHQSPTMSDMTNREPAVSPRRAAAAAWLSTVLTLAWAWFSHSRFENGWGVTVVGVLALVAFGLPLGLQRSTRALGLGLCLGAVSGLVIAALVALVV